MHLVVETTYSVAVHPSINQPCIGCLSSLPCSRHSTLSLLCCYALLVYILTDCFYQPVSHCVGVLQFDSQFCTVPEFRFCGPQRWHIRHSGLRLIIQKFECLSKYTGLQIDFGSKQANNHTYDFNVLNPGAFFTLRWKWLKYKMIHVQITNVESVQCLSIK